LQLNFYGDALFDFTNGDVMVVGIES